MLPALSSPMGAAPVACLRAVAARGPLHKKRRGPPAAAASAPSCSRSGWPLPSLPLLLAICQVDDVAITHLSFGTEFTKASWLAGRVSLHGNGTSPVASHARGGLPRAALHPRQLLFSSGGSRVCLLPANAQRLIPRARPRPTLAAAGCGEQAGGAARGGARAVHCDEGGAGALRMLGLRRANLQAVRHCPQRQRPLRLPPALLCLLDNLGFFPFVPPLPACRSARRL